MHNAQCMISISVLSLVFACGSPPTENRSTPEPSPKPTPTEAARVDKPINVSFSTYSKDWPVGWEWIDPDQRSGPTPHDVTSGVLRIRIPNGKNLYGETRNAPRYLKAITGDFQIETRVKFLPKENYQGAGLLIYVHGDNYIRFERSYGGVGGGGEGIRFDVRDAEGYKPVIAPGEIRTDAGEVELKIVRSGQMFTGYWRIRGAAEWTKAGEFVANYPQTILAGLVACNTAEEITAEFAYIRLLPV
jgi:hypothetical protein